MSLKPKKVSEIKKIEAKLKAKASKMDSLNKLPPYTMIVSEGVKTEPFYIQGFVDKVNEKYFERTAYSCVWNRKKYKRINLFY